jgi:diguanylate cyclase (GGDEF)-like protein
VRYRTEGFLCSCNSGAARRTMREGLRLKQMHPPSREHSGVLSVTFDRLRPAWVNLRRMLSIQSAHENIKQGAPHQSCQVRRLLRANTRLKRKVAKLQSRIAQVRHFAYHDCLTGLPNRALLLDRLRQAMAQAARHRTLVAVLLIDLDGFKHVNDTRGHEAGDRLLRAIAVRLRKSVRGCDTVSRYGGDEFVIMLPQVDGREGAERVAIKVRALLNAPFALHGTRVSLSASIGIALYQGICTRKRLVGGNRCASSAAMKRLTDPGTRELPGMQHAGGGAALERGPD